MKVVGLWVANGNWEWHFAHNKCDIVPTSQKATKVSNQLSWMLAPTRNTFQKKKAKTTNPTSLWCDNHFYDSIFTVPWAPSCHFSGWRKQQPSGRNPWKVTRHPKTFRPCFQKKKVCLKRQLEFELILLQYSLLLENPPHVKLSSNSREMLQRPLWKNYPLSR